MATFKLPFNDRLTVRFFERVETTDPQYDIVDCGVEYNDGSRDTIAVGGAFTSFKKWTAPKSKEEKLARRKAKRKAKRQATPSESTEVDTTSDE